MRQVTVSGKRSLTYTALFPLFHQQRIESAAAADGGAAPAGGPACAATLLAPTRLNHRAALVSVRRRFTVKLTRTAAPGGFLDALPGCRDRPSPERADVHLVDLI